MNNEHFENAIHDYIAGKVDDSALSAIASDPEVLSDPELLELLNAAPKLRQAFAEGRLAFPLTTETKKMIMKEITSHESRITNDEKPKIEEETRAQEVSKIGNRKSRIGRPPRNPLAWMAPLAASLIICLGMLTFFTDFLKSPNRDEKFSEDISLNGAMTMEAEERAVSIATVKLPESGVQLTSVFAHDTFHAGSKAGMRVMVEVAESVAKSVPLPGAAVRILLQTPEAVANPHSQMSGARAVESQTESQGVREMSPPAVVNVPGGGLPRNQPTAPEQNPVANADAVPSSNESEAHNYANSNLSPQSGVYSLRNPGLVFEGLTDANGTVNAIFDVPLAQLGAYQLTVITSSRYGSEMNEQNIFVVKDAKLMLTTDKPLYQPGQTMHFRGLALSPATLRPVSGAELTFEVRDSEQNIVFRRKQITSDFGVVSASFRLAEEVNEGPYSVQVQSADNEDLSAGKTVRVERYTLPPFGVTLDIGRVRDFRPGETVSGSLSSVYRFGQKVKNADVIVEAILAGDSVAQFHGTTDESGDCKFELLIPDDSHTTDARLEAASNRLVLSAKVTDETDHEEGASQSLTLSREPLKVGVLIDGGTLTADVTNVLYVVVQTPGGAPARDKIVKVTLPFVGEIIANTKQSGIAEVPFFADSAKLTDQGGGNFEVPVRIEVTDQTGAKVRHEESFRAKKISAGALVIRPSQGVLLGGESLTLSLQSTMKDCVAYIDLLKGEQVVQSTSARIMAGEAKISIQPRPDVLGTIVVHAYALNQEGDVLSDTRVVYVQAQNNLQVELSADQEDSYQPGEIANFGVSVRAYDGSPVQAALGIIMVDTAVFMRGGTEIRPGIEEIYFSLVKELFERDENAGKTAPNVSIDELALRREALEDAEQLAARVLLSEAKPAVAFDNQISGMIRKQRSVYYAMENVYCSMVTNFCATSSTVNIVSGTVTLDSELIDNMIASNALTADAATDAFGHRMSALDLAHVPLFSANLIAMATTNARLATIADAATKYYGKHSAELLNSETRQVELPANFLALLDESSDGIDSETLKDAWGKPFELWKPDSFTPGVDFLGLGMWELRSAGPDGMTGTSDDVTRANVQYLTFAPRRSDIFLYRASRAEARNRGAPDLASLNLTQVIERLKSLDQSALDELQTLGLAEIYPGIQKAFVTANALRRNYRRPELRGGERFENEPVEDEGAVWGADDLDRRADGAPRPGRAGGIGGGGAMPPVANAPGGEMPEEERLRGFLEDAEATGDEQEQGSHSGGLLLTGQNAPQRVRVRDYFPETLLFEPNLITDENGMANFTVPLADSITTWELMITANARSGGLGSAHERVVVFQDFFCEPDLPVALTRNDVINLRVIVSVNQQAPVAQTVHLKLHQAPWFELVDDSAEKDVRLDLGAGFSRSVVDFRIRALRVGEHDVTIEAHGANYADAVRQKVRVDPGGDMIVTSVSGTLGENFSTVIDVPENAIEGSERVIARFYPGVLSQVIEGAEGLLRQPGGCFEQTSSSTYPNILVLDYLRTTEQESPDIEKRALDYIGAGYQRLLSFEVDGRSGGFSWFGEAPANKILTAYGLHEFADMAKVYDAVDPDLIRRVQNFLASEQSEDGSWSPDQSYLHSENWQKIQNSNLLVTAYVMRSLIASGYANEAVMRKGFTYLEDHLDEVDNAYTRGFVLDVAVNAQRRGLPVDALVRTVNGSAKSEGELRYFDPEMPTATFAHGNSASIETTAMNVLGLAKARSNRAFSREVYQGALDWLVSKRDPSGGFGGTMATVLTFKALLAGLESSSRDASARITVSLGEARQSFRLNADNYDMMHQVLFMPEDVEHAGNNLRIEMVGTAKPAYQIVTRYAIPARNQTNPLDIDVEYGKDELAPGETTTVRVLARNVQERYSHMVMLDVPVAPGFEVLGEPFEALVTSGKITRFENQGDRYVLYTEGLPAGGSFEFEFEVVARIPAEIQTPMARVWEYYNPEVEGFSELRKLVIRN
ncbi:MAG: MG2 domain-containing protein [Planctomycetes bacterium]|nr:MG2 domain-containing protein [Planctomycetota bacterium]